MSMTWDFYNQVYELSGLCNRQDMPTKFKSRQQQKTKDASRIAALRQYTFCKLPSAPNFAYAIDWSIEGHSNEDSKEILRACGVTPDVTDLWKQQDCFP